MIELENEKEIFEAGYVGIVPFLMEENEDGLYIEAYSGLEDLAVQFELRFENEYFEKAALEWLDVNIRDYLEEHGYYREDRGVYRWYHSFVLDDIDALNTSLIRPDTVHLTKKTPSQTLIKANEHLELSMPVFATLDKGEVISIATLNPHSEGQMCLEITAETAVSYRRHGYAASNAAALSKYLLENGYSVAYCCSRYNKTSAKIAKKIGFKENGRFYAVDAYKKQ